MCAPVVGMTFVGVSSNGASADPPTGVTSRNPSADWRQSITPQRVGLAANSLLGLLAGLVDDRDVCDQVGGGDV